MIVGITGGIGTGKSTASRILGELGVTVIDVDRVFHQMLVPGDPVFEAIVKEFGPRYLNPDGTLNRRRLGTMVFSHPEKLRLLGTITHPAVKERVTALVKETRSKGEDGVIDHPLLFETKMENLADEVWVVAAPEEVQTARIMKRNNLSREEALKRIKAQMPLEEKIARADVVIDNSGEVKELKEKVINLWKERIECSRESP